MDSHCHNPAAVQLHLMNSARRAPMNQDEFDTKFNFLKESRARELSMDDAQPPTHSAHFRNFCCGNIASSNNLSSNRNGSRRVSNTHSNVIRGPRYELNGGDFDDENRQNPQKACFVRYFPLIECLQEYSFREHFLGDLSAGIALGLHSAVEGEKFYLRKVN
ncbi:hypothetical protein Ddc_15173 [Ditylenchus destructor]|nr:hypothetical protein Ddc_15173 [Ditylenchus destructor]